MRDRQKPNKDALLKEYELRFGYTSRLVTTLVSFFSPQFVFMGASVVAYFSKNSDALLKHTLCAANLTLSTVALFWNFGIASRHRASVERVNVLSNIVGLGTYYPQGHKVLFIRVSMVFSKLWFVSCIFLWVVLWVSI